MISISLEMIVRNKNNQIKKAIAINEVSVLNKADRQLHYLSSKALTNNQKLVSDGVLVSTQRKYRITPTWTNLSLHSKGIYITISAFRPQDGRVKLLMTKPKLL